MPRFIIRYDTKPEATALNAKLVEDVFTELKSKAPAGVHYAVLRNGDTFYHLVAYENEAENEQLTELASFKAFQKDGESRRAAAFQRSDVQVVGNYGLLVE
jgi:hypothetical protein